MTGPRLNRMVIGTFAAWVLVLAAMVPGSLRADELADRAAVIKPAEKELAWLQIPWVLDLKAAQKTAQAEGRPILLWVTGDDPLERC